MQIDFHHAVTYVTARLAGYSIEEADILSYSAQYVDDAINSGPIRFDNRAMYSRISSSHKTLDYRNFKELANHNVWVPFHFLPGNGGKKADENGYDSFVEKLVCTPGSYVAEDMIRSSIYGKNYEYSLHRLGITLHVLADTYAHQGFAGINHRINNVIDIERDDDKQPTFLDKLKDYFGDIFDKIASRFVSDVLPLGHGGALSCPDLPFLSWSYKNGMDKNFKRDNADIFIEAVKKMHLTMIRYKKSDPDYQITEKELICEADLNRIRSNFLNFTDEEGKDRHKKWIESVAKGDFSFCKNGGEKIKYIEDGENSWIDQALKTGSEKNTEDEVYEFRTEFLNSNWKLFHDALQVHRIDIIRNILPKYGICAA